MATNTSKALTAWEDLNDRQQSMLRIIFDLDQAAEAARNLDRARGSYDNTPASEWRAIDFSYFSTDPSKPNPRTMTELQRRLKDGGWHNQGNGATVAALVDRALIAEDQVPAGRPGINLLRVRMTRAGRAAARAATRLPNTAAGKTVLSRRSWEVLALLWDTDTCGQRLDWGYSSTIERVLIAKHQPPLAEHRAGGYALTDRGRQVYRDLYAAHVAAWPEVSAAHPDGQDAEPWPARADDLLAQHEVAYHRLCHAWYEAHAACQAAATETHIEAPPLDENLPEVIAHQSLQRHQLWHDTAVQRHRLAAAHAAETETHIQRAARDWVIAALTAFGAAVAGTNPLEQLNSPDPTDTWDEAPLAPPTATSIYAIDNEASRLHAAAVGKPRRRRGPAPKPRRSHTEPAPPGAALAEFADFLQRHVKAGELTRRLHAAAHTTHE